MSPSDILLEEEEGADVDGANQDGAEREGGVAESDCRDLNYASLRLTVVMSVAHMTEKWHKIHMIAKGKMSLSRVAISLYTSIRERIKCEGKSIVRCSNKESKKDRKSTRLNSSHSEISRMPSSA